MGKISHQGKRKRATTRQRDESHTKGEQTERLEEDWLFVDQLT